MSRTSNIGSLSKFKGESTMAEQTNTPNPDLKGLDRLIGTWKVSGGTQGETRYEWMEGGFFLLQHIDMVSDGRPIKGLEVIGHLQSFGEEPGADIMSRY